MDLVVDLDPTHRVLRITVTRALTDESSSEIYRAIASLAATGGPYASILDLSQVEDYYPASAKTIRTFAAAAPVLPAGRPRVVVVPQPALFGLARMFEMHRDSMEGQFHVVHSMDEAYELLEVNPEDFTQRLLPESMAA
jgi:hypothetical protein